VCPSKIRAHHETVRAHTLLLPFLQVLYNLFEWPVRPGSRLAVIGVSNTHDLDERLLPRIARSVWYGAPEKNA